MSEKILIIDDEQDIADLLEVYLKNENYVVYKFYCATDAMSCIESGDIDLAILDIMLPEEDGLSILKKIRIRPDVRKLPVIMLTAKGSEFDTVVGLDSGADDYIPKPFRMMELLSRIRALLRRSAPEDSGMAEYRVGPLYVCPRRHIIQVDGHDVALTRKEFDLLCLLLSERGTVFTREQLLDTIWGYAFDGESRTVDVHVRSLRQKLGAGGDCIETVRGIGYKISEA